MSKIKVGISIGDPNGIGLEIIMKTFKDSRILDFCTPIVFGCSKATAIHRKILNMQDFNFNVISKVSDANAKRTNLINIRNKDIDIKLGETTKECGQLALNSIKEACKALKKNEIDVLVTAPINKDAIQKNEASFIGHTEFLENNFEGQSLMIMASEIMRIAFITGHIALKDVKKSITKNKIIEKSKRLNTSLIQDFRIRAPKIAVLGLNPHAGENGLLGDEEEQCIIPAINELKKEGILAFGPYPADSFFTEKNLKNFDGILAMYHDQGLTAFKTLSFFDGVNYTAGLDIIRTSPVHGTAYEIAGKGEANEKSFRESIFMACEIHKKRLEFELLNKNPLKFKDKK